MIVTVANQKGGVGKTDLTVNLAASLAMLGKRVMVLDLDPQANATEYLMAEHPKLNTSNLLLDTEVGIKDIMLETETQNLFLGPGSPRLNGAQVELLSDPGMQFRLKRKLKHLKGFDYIFIDTPPSLGLLTINALTASDGVIIPVQVHHFATGGVEKLMVTVENIRKEINPKLEVLGFVLTMYDKRNKLSFLIDRQVREVFGGSVFNTHIPVNVNLAHAPSQHRHIHIHSSNCRGAYAYMNLAREMLERGGF